jgi:hypothetical protein
MPVVQMAGLVGETDTRIWRIVRGHVKRAYEKKMFDGTVKMGVDETSSRKGHKYGLYSQSSGYGILKAPKSRVVSCFGRPNEFIIAHLSPEKDGNVKGAERRGLTREPLILLAFSDIFGAVMGEWAAETQPIE